MADRIGGEALLCEVWPVDVAKGDPKTSYADLAALTVFDGAELTVQYIDLRCW
jgi:hypothetical protein